MPLALAGLALLVAAAVLLVPAAGVSAQSPSTDASLSALRIRPAPAEDLSTGKTSFETTVGTEHYYVRVDATPSDPGAAVVITPGDFRDHDDGHQVQVGLGRTRVTVTVTAADGATTRTYTVFVKQGTVPAFGRKAAEDFDTIAGTANAHFQGLWSDGTTMWVADSSDEKLYAYRMSDMTRDAAKDFDLDAAGTAGNDVAQGIWSDGTTMWVANDGPDKIFAYRMSDKARDSAKDFNTLTGALNNSPQGIWSDGTTMWVADSGDDKLYAYRMSDKARDSAKDFNTLDAALNNSPRGIWSDGTTMWVVDIHDKKLYAYRMSDKARVAALDFNTLDAAGNGDPESIWSDGTTAWVSDWRDQKLYAYDMPVYGIGAVVRGSNMTIFFNRDLREGTLLDNRQFIASKIPWWRAERIWVPLPQGSPPVIRGNTATLTMSDTPASDLPRPTAGTDHSYRVQYVAERDRSPRPLGFGEVIYDLLESDNRVAAVDFEVSALRYTPYASPSSPRAPATAGQPYTFSVQDFHFPFLHPVDSMSTVSIMTLPGKGTLSAGGRVITNADLPWVFSAEELHAGSMVWTPPAGALSSASHRYGSNRLWFTDFLFGAKVAPGDDIETYRMRIDLEPGVLVKNTGQTTSVISRPGSSYEEALPFRTGSNPGGYRVESVSLRLNTTSSSTLPSLNLHEGSPTAPGFVRTIVNCKPGVTSPCGTSDPIFRKPGVQSSSGTYDYRYWVRYSASWWTSPFRLKPNTTYYIVATGLGSVDFPLITSGAIDAGSQPGFTLPTLQFRTSSTGNFISTSDHWRFLFDVEGVAVPSGGMHSPHNALVTGLPRIVGEAFAAEPLTVDMSAVADSDGLRRAEFEYQWLVDGVAASGETGTRFVPFSDDVGKSVTVRVSFVDDAGYAESLISAAVGPIGAGGLRAKTAAVDGATLTLTYNEILDETRGGIPPASAFAVTASGAPVAVTAVSVLGTKVTLTLGTAVTHGVAVAVDYTPAELGFVRDTLGRTAPSFSGLSAANGTAGVPGPPTALTAAAFSATRIDLSWSAPADDGGAAVSGYRIEMSEDGETWTVLVANNTGARYTHSGLAANSARRYRVSALNSVGAGPASGAAAATTDILVRNHGQSNDSIVYSPLELSQGFRTGSHSGGYDLAGVDVVSPNIVGAYVAAAIWTVNDDGDPGEEHAALTLTDSAAAGTISYTAPEGTTLVTDTEYALVLTVLYGAYGYYDLTDSDHEDSGALAGWSIGDAYQHKNSSDEWQDNTAGRALRFAVRGASRPDTQSDTQPNNAATGAPTISGAAQVGETLTASTTGIVDIDGLTKVSYTYQWVSNDGTDDADISGATTGSYTLVSDDVGNTIKVRVSFSDDEGNEESLTSAATAEVDFATSQQQSANTAATGAPTIGGTAQVGETLTASTTGIADEDGLTNVSYTYQWVRNNGTDDSDIGGATAGSYTLVGGDVGKTIKVRVSFTDDADNAESLTSDATASVTARPNTAASGAPAISGTAQVGETLTVSTTGIADSDGLTNVSYTYQWVRNDGTDDSDISGATTVAYTLVSGDVGKTIKVRVSFTDDAGNAESLTSDATVAVAAAPPPLTASAHDAPASHDGSASFTFELRFSEDFSIGYARLRDHAFTVTGGEVVSARRLERGRNIRWQITVRPSGNADVSVVLPATTDCTAQSGICTGDDRKLSNDLTVRVAGPPINAPAINTPATGAPAISGTAQVGETLTASTTGIADADGLTNVSYAYQWLADDAELSGATGAAYTLVAGDQGKTIKVRVSFTDDAGNAESLTSAATSAVTPPPLTASVRSAPATHDGNTAFTFELRFSIEPELSYRTLRDHAFTETGGEVIRARRLDRGQNLRWEITVRPDSTGAVTLILPPTTDCTAQAAICTDDDRKLSGRLEITVPGPEE